MTWESTSTSIMPAFERATGVCDVLGALHAQAGGVYGGFDVWKPCGSRFQNVAGRDVTPAGIGSAFWALSASARPRSR